MSRDPGYTREVRELCLQLLTPLQMQVLDGRLGRGWSYRKIGTAMNLDEATVRGHYERALRRLGPAFREVA